MVTQHALCPQFPVFKNEAPSREALRGYLPHQLVRPCWGTCVNSEACWAGACPQSFPPTLPVSENTGSEISLPWIVTQVCSVPPWSEAKAIFLETPLSPWPRVKVEGI